MAHTSHNDAEEGAMQTVAHAPIDRERLLFWQVQRVDGLVGSHRGVKWKPRKRTQHLVVVSRLTVNIDKGFIATAISTGCSGTGAPSNHGEPSSCYLGLGFWSEGPGADPLSWETWASTGR